MDIVNKESGLYPEDQKLENMITELWNYWTSIKDKNQFDNANFFECIHTLQRIAMSRSLRKSYPDYWRQ
jgi:hypothetical protein